MNFIFGILLYDRFLPVCFFLGSVLGPWQLLFIISWKNIFLKENSCGVFCFLVFLKIHEWHKARKEKTVTNSTFSDCVCGALWEAHAQIERAGVCGPQGSRKAGVRDWSLPGSLQARLGWLGLPAYHTRLPLMRAAPDAFCTEGDNFLFVWHVEVSRLLQGGQE